MLIAFVLASTLTFVSLIRLLLSTIACALTAIFLVLFTMLVVLFSTLTFVSLIRLLLSTIAVWFLPINVRFSIAIVPATLISFVFWSTRLAKPSKSPLTPSILTFTSPILVLIVLLICLLFSLIFTSMFLSTLLRIVVLFSLIFTSIFLSTLLRMFVLLLVIAVSIFLLITVLLLEIAVLISFLITVLFSSILALILFSTLVIDVPIWPFNLLIASSLAVIRIELSTILSCK